jgi:hypothetical protein
VQRHRLPLRRAGARIQTFSAVKAWSALLDDSEAKADDSARGGRQEDRLDSWKKIASYLKRDVSTVQRWERREGMPVHRHLHDKLGSVFA